MEGKLFSVNNMSGLFMSSIKGNEVIQAATASTLFGAVTIQQSIKVKWKITDCFQASRWKSKHRRHYGTAKVFYLASLPWLWLWCSCTFVVTQSNEHTRSLLTRTKTAGGLEPVSTHRHLFTARRILCNLALINQKLWRLAHLQNQLRLQQ